MVIIGSDGVDGVTAKNTYEDLSIIHAALGEDWQTKLVDIIRLAQLPELRSTFHRWEVDHGYRRRR